MVYFCFVHTEIIFESAFNQIDGEVGKLLQREKNF